MTTEETDNSLEALRKEKQKLLALVPGGGMMGADAKEEIVTRGLTPEHGPIYSCPRGRRRFRMLPLLRKGAVLLKGHDVSEPIFESDKPFEDGVQSFVIDGAGGRFIDMYGDKGECLIAHLRERLLLHTLTPEHHIRLLKVEGGDSQEYEEEVSDDFKRRLLEALGPPAELGEGEEAPHPVKKPRTTLFTEAMIRKLKAWNSEDPPRIGYKLFDPEGAGTWFVCSMEDDGDTLWVVADLGLGVVEYGTQSLQELEEHRGPNLGLHIERDRHFQGVSMPVSELLDLITLHHAR